MSGWKIVPGGVEGVLRQVGTTAETLGKAVDGLPGSAEAALAGSDQCPIIGEALMSFFNHHKPTLTGIGNRINASVGGAATATRWYLQGDEEMAGQQQAAAATVATTGVSTFTQPKVPQ